MTLLVKTGSRGDPSAGQNRQFSVAKWLPLAVIAAPHQSGLPSTLSADKKNRGDGCHAAPISDLETLKEYAQWLAAW